MIGIYLYKVVIRTSKFNGRQVRENNGKLLQTNLSIDNGKNNHL